jgi:tRNA1(Val) A37 N6-methylase TrmN6
VFDGRTIRFDYDPHDVLREIVVSGCVPDKVSHQYYPTPEHVARAAVAMLDPHDGGSYLEPSAGQGAIAELLPKDRTTCIEISEVHCAILRAKGFTVKQADFIAWAARHDGCFDRIAMNPPYAEGQYMAHVEAAASLLAPSGQMVAIVPASQRGKDLVPGMRSEWSEVFVNEFAGTSMDVAIWKGVRA